MHRYSQIVNQSWLWDLDSAERDACKTLQTSFPGQETYACLAQPCCHTFEQGIFTQIQSTMHSQGHQYQELTLAAVAL